MDKASTLLNDIPDSPAGRRMKWYLAMLLSAGEGACAADSDRYVPEIVKRMGVIEAGHQERESWRDLAHRIGEISELKIEPQSDHKVDALFTAAKDRKWRLSIEVEDTLPYRMSKVAWERQFEFNLDVREATAADAPILADIERRSRSCSAILTSISSAGPTTSRSLD